MPMVAPVPIVMLVSTSKLPWKLVVAPKVAELPTCQNTSQAPVPLISSTLEPAAVVNVLPILKMKTELMFVPPSSVNVPVSCAEEENL